MAELNAIEHNLELRMLGGFSLTIDGKALPSLRTRKGQWLIALLALRNGRPVERTWLAGMLWPDSLEVQSLCNLRRALTDLRSALGPAADRVGAPTPRTLSLDLRDDDLADIYLFKHLLDVGESPALEQAVGLYRGQLLEGCDEHWVFQERLTTELMYLSAMETLAARYLDENRFDEAIGLLITIISIDPLRETARRCLMNAYASNGNLSSAVLAYREFRELVRRELNSIPDAETSELYQRIRSNVERQPAEAQSHYIAATSQRTAPAPGHLPRPLSLLVGRTAEKDSLSTALANGRLITLLGSGGIGKTRLALQAAETACEGFRDGAWFADLSGIKAPEMLASLVASVLEIPEDAAESPRDRLAGHLEQKELLLVLDNCEHLVSACAELADGLLSTCPMLKIIATSREPFGINGEHRWNVPALSRPTVEGVANALNNPEELLKYDSIRLFVERGKGMRPDFALTGQNAAYVVEICNRLDGIPLSIELAAARLSVLTSEQIVTRLQDRFRLLTGGSRTAWPRHQTLLAMIEWSHDLLSDAEKTLFRRLAIFSGGWTVDDLECVAFGDADQTEQLDLFTSLLEKSLVQADTEVQGERRYRMLESIREFALDRLKSAGEWDEACSMHAKYFLLTAQSASVGLNTSERERWIQRFVCEHDNMRSALGWAICTTGEAETAALLVTSMSRFWYLQCLYREGLHWLEQVLELDERIDPSILCKVHNGAGSMYWVMGHFDAAEACYERHLAICREHNDELGLGYALMNLGLVAMHRGEYPLARSRMEESIVLLRLHGDRNILASPLSNLAIVVKDMGELDYAFRLLAESYALNQEHNNTRGMAATVILRANLERRLGKNDVARASMLEVLSLYTGHGDRQSYSITLHNLGDLSQQEEDYTAARAYYTECLDISHELADRRQVATTLCSLAQLNRAEGSLREYKSMYRQSADLALEMKERVLIVTMLTDLAAQAEIARNLPAIPRIAGALDAALEQYGTPLNDLQKTTLQRVTAIARKQLGEQAYCAAFKEGQSTTLEHALNAALES